MEYIHKESGLQVNIRRIEYTEDIVNAIGEKTGSVVTGVRFETDGGQPAYPRNGDIASMNVQTPLGDVTVLALNPLVYGGP